MTRIDSRKPQVQKAEDVAPIVIPPPAPPAEGAMPLIVPSQAPLVIATPIVVPIATGSETVQLWLNELAPLEPKHPPETPPSDRLEVKLHTLAKKTAKLVLPQKDEVTQIAFDAQQKKVKETQKALPPAQQSAIATIVQLLPKGPSSLLDGALSLCSAMDVEMLCQIVMWEMASDATDDLRELLTEMKKNNAKKKALREYKNHLKAERAQMDSELAARYEERTTLPPDDARYINPEEMTLDEFKTSQALVLDESTGDLGISPNETYYPPPMPDFYPDPPVLDDGSPNGYHPESESGAGWRALREQLILTPEQYNQLAFYFMQHFPQQVNDPEAFAAWVVRPRDQGGAGLDGTPGVEGNAAAFAAFLAAPKNAPSFAEIGAIYNITQGEALALWDYYRAANLGAPNPTAFRAWIDSGSGPDMKANATYDQHLKVSQFFNEIKRQNTGGFYDLDDPGAPDPENHNQNTKSKAEQYDNDADHVSDKLSDDVIGTLDELLKNLLNGMLKMMQAERESSYGNSADDFDAAAPGDVGQLQKILFDFVKTLPPLDQNEAMQYLMFRGRQVQTELMYSAQQSSEASGPDINGGAHETSDSEGFTEDEYLWLRDHGFPQGYHANGGINAQELVGALEIDLGSKFLGWGDVDDLGGPGMDVFAVGHAMDWLNGFADALHDFHIAPANMPGWQVAYDFLLDPNSHYREADAPLGFGLAQNKGAEAQALIDAYDEGADAAKEENAEEYDAAKAQQKKNNDAAMAKYEADVAAAQANEAAWNEKYTPPHDDTLNEKSLAQIDEHLGSIDDQLDSFNALSEENSIKIQLAQERLTRAHSTLSNMMKKFSDTAQSIIGNLK